jgi:hypothetical protein
MSELSRLIWRYEAGYLLREKVRDRFLEETEGLRDRMRWLVVRFRACQGEKGASDKTDRVFDEAARTAERSARLERFRDSLKETQRAEAAVETMSELCDAYTAIRGAEEQLLRIERALRGFDFPSVNDFRILINRSQEFVRQDEFRVARFIAEEAMRALLELGAVEANDGPPPPNTCEGLERQEGIAAALAELGVAFPEEGLVRRGVTVVRETLASRQFNLAAVLLGDLEEANGPIETFLSQKRLAERYGMRESVNEAMAILRTHRERSGEIWRNAAALLTEESINLASRRMGPKAPAAVENP